MWGSSQEFSEVGSFGQLAKFLESKYAFTGLVAKVIFVQFPHLGVSGCPQIGNVTVCPRGVGTSATISFPGYCSRWAGASGIPQLPYENVDVYSDFLNLDVDGQMPVATYAPG